MTPTGFSEALRLFLGRSPFRPFLIELTSGSRLRVERPDAIESLEFAYSYRFSPGSREHVFDSDSVAMLLEVGRPDTIQLDPDFSIDLDSPGDEDGPFVLS